MNNASTTSILAIITCFVVAIAVIVASSASYNAGKKAGLTELHSFIMINDGYEFAKGDVEYEYYKMKAKKRAEVIVIEKLSESLGVPLKPNDKAT